MAIRRKRLGRLVAKSRSHVANLLRLLELPAPVRAMVADGALSMGHARALITSADPETLAREVVQRGNFRCARRQASPARPRARPARPRRSSIRAATRISPHSNGNWAICWALKVTIQHQGQGGAVTIALFLARSARHDLSALERRADLIPIDLNGVSASGARRGRAP